MLTTDQIIACRLDFLTFIKAVTPGGTKDNWHINTICTALERVVCGDISRLIINVPPSSGKTFLSVINFMAWSLGNFPDSQFIHLSYTKGIAAKNSNLCRWLMMSKEYQEIFPDVRLRKDSKAKHEFHTEQGGFVYAAGFDGTITGYHAGKKHTDDFRGAIIFDDAHKIGEAQSKIRREHVIDNYYQNVPSRVNRPTTPIVGIGQRSHAEDLYGVLLAEENGKKWKHISIPVLDENDKSFYENDFPAAQYITMREKFPYIFYSQFQQHPTILGGNLIKTDFFVRYSVLPPIKYRVIYADTAQKTKEHNDYSVFECWGYGEDGKIYLIDMIRGKWEAPQLKQRAVDFWNSHSKDPKWRQCGALRTLKIEDAASGTGLIQELKQQYRIPIQSITRVKDKYTRLTDVVDYIHSGYVCLPQESPFVNEFVVECQSFTADDTHAHDDQIDPMIDAITDMLASGNITKVWESIL